jgi:hypothetical protein
MDVGEEVLSLIEILTRISACCIGAVGLRFIPHVSLSYQNLRPSLLLSTPAFSYVLAINSLYMAEPFFSDKLFKEIRDLNFEVVVQVAPFFWKFILISTLI